MVKKAIPLILMSGLVLGACNMNGNGTPNKNETPMQVEDRNRDWTPNVNENGNGTRGGTNLDGINNGTDGNGNGRGNGVINNTPDGTMTNPNLNTPNEEIIIEENAPNTNHNR